MWCLQRRWYCWFSVWFWIVFCNKKHSPQNLCGKEETFFQSVFEWSKRHTIFEETTTCTLPQAIPYSLFHDKILHFVEKIYRRHNNLMTGVLWRTLRSIITSRIFWFCKKDILVGGISLFEGSRVDIYFQWSFVTLQLNPQRGVKNIASSSLEKKNN